MSATNIEPRYPVYCGCAGWSLSGPFADKFPAEGTHLARYATVLPAVEINSSFYRPHRPETYAKWAKSVPPDFRFAVKVPKVITHESRLTDSEDNLDIFLSQVRELGDKLGPLLIQLPGSFVFEPGCVEQFLVALRQRYDGAVVLEPRHPSWFEDKAEMLVTNYRAARVAADPAVIPAASQPAAWPGLCYFRLHGSPRMYYSDYSDEVLDELSQTILTKARSAPVWCIFDNTAAGAALGNALSLRTRTASGSSGRV